MLRFYDDLYFYGFNFFYYYSCVQNRCLTSTLNSYYIRRRNEKAKGKFDKPPLHLLNFILRTSSVITMSCESGRYYCCDCKESYPGESIFKCETCQVEQGTNSDNKSSTDDSYCDTCIVRHCKKGHKILDSVSQTVLVCHQHKMLLNDYCWDCDILLCLKCTREHKSHKLAPIEERAKEIRTNVFEQLTNFENMEKPARKQKELVLETTKANRERLQKAIKAFEKTQQSFLSELDDAEKKSEIAVESILQKQNELRGLLSLSCQDLVLVHKWKYIKNPNEDNLTAKLGGESSVSEDWGMQGLVMKLGNNWLDCLGLNLSCTATDVENEQKMFSDTYRGKLYVVVMKRDSLELIRYSTGNKKTKCKFKLVGTIKESKLSSSIESIKAVSWDWIILFMSDGGILEASFKAECITMCEVPAGRDLLYPYTFRHRSPKVDWIYWENEHVKSTQNDKFKIEFKIKPKVMFLDLFDRKRQVWVLLDQETMLITVVDSSEEERNEIPQSVHGCNSIDFIDSYSVYKYRDSFYADIVLWSVEMKSITLILINGSVRGNFNSEVIGRVNWTDDLEVKRYQTKSGFRNDHAVYWWYFCQL